MCISDFELIKPNRELNYDESDFLLKESVNSAHEPKIPTSSIKEVILMGCGSNDVSKQETVTLNSNALKVSAYAVECETRNLSLDVVIKQKLKILNFHHKNNDIYNPHEKLAFAIFLQASIHSNKGSLYDTIIKLSLKQLLLEGMYPRLWTLVFHISEQDDSEVFEGWTEFLQEVLLKTGVNGASPRQSFYKLLYSHVEDAFISYGVDSEEAQELLSNYNSIIDNNCYFPIF